MAVIHRRLAVKAGLLFSLLMAFGTPGAQAASYPEPRQSE